MSDWRRSGAPEPSLTPRIIWALCTVARSGSSWLSELAGSTHRLGYPDEYLLDWGERCGEWGLNSTTGLDQFLSMLIPRKSSPNGVFAIKGSPEELTPFFARFPHTPCCWLRREDKVEQAVSWYRAHHGGAWTRLSDAPPAPSPLEFSLAEILNFHDEILRREALWHQFFLSRRSPPLVITYEQVCRDPLAAVRGIAAYVGVDPRQIQHVHSPLRVVRDELTTRWVARVKQTLESPSST
jgi:trehalose 2-sulfotransferase